MEKKWRELNVWTYLVAAAIMSSMIITSFSSGHPWAITCYQCKACSLRCPLGYDVSMYVTAALTNNPDLYMNAKNLQLPLKVAYETDPNMLVEIDGKLLTAKEAYNKYNSSTVVWVRRLKVKDAAKFDPLDGNCETLCPINLKITNIIRDLKDDGKFG